MNQSRTFACVLGALLLTGCPAAGAAGYPAAGAAGYPAAGAARHATGHTAAGAARPTGHVIGRLLIAGGPMGPGGQQPGERPIPGTVTFTAAGHRPVAVGVGVSGKFSVWLAPGRYQVAGRSPRILTVTSTGKDEERTCSAPLSVTVRARHTTTIAVVCPVP
jgi:hypothetical protein